MIKGSCCGRGGRKLTILHIGPSNLPRIQGKTYRRFKNSKKPVDAKLDIDLLIPIIANIVCIVKDKTLLAEISLIIRTFQAETKSGLCILFTPPVALSSNYFIRTTSTIRKRSSGKFLKCDFSKVATRSMRSPETISVPHVSAVIKKPIALTCFPSLFSKASSR